MKPVVIAILIMISLVFASMACNPFGESERVKAIGSTADLPATLQRAFHPGNGFSPLESPKPGDWLAEHKEPGQTFPEFAVTQYNRPDNIRKKIYLQPLGTFAGDKSPSIDTLRDYAQVYFAMDVEVLPPIPLNDEFTPRINRITGKRQILSTDVLNFLRTRLPSDAFCILAVTMEDLYPEPAWNYVFGQASLTERTGVYSFARYDPAFHGEKRGSDYEKVLLKRSCRILAHESGHMFGLQHCIFFRCIMNGSNHLKESDSQPLHLCPVCLRKLQYSIGFDILKRYEDLGIFYKKNGFDDEAQWGEKRIKYIAATS
jgi:archaemetzincin